MYYLFTQREVRNLLTGKIVSLLPPSATPTVEDEEESQPDARLQDHDESQAAFNPETGEINWDCPCLGGMAYGPCGEEFRAAFSCFVYSKEEPKGMDCIDKFKFVKPFPPLSFEMI